MITGTLNVSHGPVHAENMTTNQRPRLLALGPQNVYPPIDGGKEGIFGALGALSAHFDVSYAFPEGASSAELSGYAEAGIRALPVNHIPVESLGVIASAMLRLRPFKFHKYATRAAVQAYCLAIPAEHYDLVLCFHAHTWRLGEAVRRRLHLDAPVMVREHNIEYEIVASFLQSLNGPARLAAAFFLRLTAWEERRMWRQADSVAFLTKRDLTNAKAQSNRGRQFLAPEGIPIPPPRSAQFPGQDAPLLLLFNPSAKQSVLNLKCFVHQHWARSCNQPGLSQTRLRITGQSETQLAQTLSIDTQQLKALRIDALGFVETLDVEFKSCLALVSPTFAGGGIRKKILEAMAHQLPVIATRLDISSTDYFHSGENILCFDDAENALSHAVVHLRDEGCWQLLSKNSRRTVEDHASWPLFAAAVAKEFAELRDAR